MNLVDAHCHFDFPAFEGRRAEVWARAQEEGVRRLVIPGVRQSDWDRVRSVAEESDAWWYCLGIHPWFVDEHGEQDLDRLREELAQAGSRCVGLGECGLDRVQGDLDAQMPWFEDQVALAGELEVPLVIHSVRTHDEVAAVLRRKPPSAPVLVHGFSGSYQQARALIDLGCYLGIGGVITHDRARKTRDTVARLPSDRLVLETDAPDMPPAGVRKGGNEPATLRQVLTCLAELRSEAAEALAEQLERNVAELYGWQR
ncbi:TatD DNase family protein [Marinobacter daqiaonensis]|uniref:TatD DNase family protein n=1 Tax=Marinobacter daqiaonensis TaxID=650891 RepID=A0A1I6J2L5_9GAMM|nr:TatD family hydrolase [Marinobacter daqiaonensis]SFR73111.1 TatD DNase family protein [Marinobacter daqiaonensis]